MFRLLTIACSVVCACLLFLTSQSFAGEPHVYPNKYGNNLGRGKTFYQNSVVPRLAENGCAKCHARGYLRPNVFVYEELIRRLAIGDSAENNVVIYKMASIRKWWDIEFGNEGGSD